MRHRPWWAAISVMGDRESQAVLRNLLHTCHLSTEDVRWQVQFSPVFYIARGCSSLQLVAACGGMVFDRCESWGHYPIGRYLSSEARAAALASRLRP